MENAPVKLGDILAGKYRVERVLGKGAMGVVVAARHLDIDRLVALKFILPQQGSAAEQAARFLREAKAASRLKSEHAGKVLDVGKLDDGRPYIVMELLSGKDLACLLREHGPLSIEEALTYILHAAHAIAEAHTVGIVHRDLKPANLFLTTGPAGEPLVKVLDFGISKLENEATSLTGTGAMLGSPLYMSPEQYRGSRDVDARSDIWGLGVILYELLAGATPFVGPTFVAVMTRVTVDPPVPLEQHRPELPRGLVAVIMQCFEKDVSRRYPSVARFVAALAPYVPPSAEIYVKRIAEIQLDSTAPARPTVELPHETGTARDAQVAPASTTPAGTAPTGGTIPGLSRGTPLWVAAAAVVAAIVLSLGVGFFLFKPSAPPTPGNSATSAASILTPVPTAAVPLVTPSAEPPAPLPPAPPSAAVPPLTPSASTIRSLHPAPGRPSAAPTAALRPQGNGYNTRD